MSLGESADEPVPVARDLNVDADLIREIVVKSRAAIFSMPTAEDEAPERELELDAATTVEQPDPTLLSDEDQTDRTREEAAAMIDSLNVDEQAEIIALTLIGRGDYEPSELDEAVRDAKTRANGPASRWLFQNDLFPDLLADGLDRYEIWEDDQPD